VHRMLAVDAASMEMHRVQNMLLHNMCDEGIHG
jgi:hypothetical protein